MAKSLKNAGQVNLKGKKSALMRCKCCSCWDMRDGILEKLVRREIRDAMRDMQRQVDQVTGRHDWI
jgi:hypothetical protein